jgi:hypothetical protein
MSNRIELAVLALSAVCALSACERHKSSAQVQKETVAAEQSAAANTAQTEQKAGERVASARSDVREEQRDLEHVGAVQNEKVADTQAEGAHKVALVRCESLSGAKLKSCKDQADADYEAAEAAAKQQRAKSDPKP